MTQPAVLAARPKRRTFPGRPDQVAWARDFTRRAIGPCPVLDEAILLVSELATNALKHTATGSGGTFDVTVHRGQDTLMIAVTDNGSNKVPATGGLDPESETGRGLELVNLIAERWGQHGGRRGRTVWFELRWDEA